MEESRLRQQKTWGTHRGRAQRQSGPGKQRGNAEGENEGEQQKRRDCIGDRELRIGDWGLGVGS